MNPRWLLLPGLVACGGDPGRRAPAKGDGDGDDTAGAALGGWAAAGDLGAQPARGLARWSGGLVATSAAGLHAAPDPAGPWTALAGTGLPEGEVSWLGSAAGDALLVNVVGEGLHRSTDGGATWVAVSEHPVQPLLTALDPRSRVVPFGAATAEDGATWLAGVGGLFRSEDGGDTWTLAGTTTSGDTNLLFTGVAARGEEVVAVAALADALLPEATAGLLSGTVFRSTDGGATWASVGAGLPAVAPMAVVLLEDAACVGTLDAGTWCSADGGATWSDLGGLTDVVALAARGDGGLGVGTASRGAWATDRAGRWSQGGAGAIAGLVADAALSTAGVALAAGEDAPPVPEDAGGTVHLALSYHVNLAHSDGGDGPTEDGYGRDLRIISGILDDLEARPGFHADWDFDGAFSLDGWLAGEAPELLARIQARVAAGTDDVRLMSWNNGAMAAETRDEFDASVAWGQESDAAAFGRTVPGVQPQDCMTSPEHLGWYADHGIEWITLFTAANSFTALRADLALDGAAAFGAVRLTDPETGGALTLVPAWHHADVLDHGGLAAWARQLSASQPGDTLLLVHFDAGAEAWAPFGTELDDLAPLVADGTVVPTTIQAWLDGHAPVAEVALPGDVADGSDDGFASWAEKDVSHRLYTEIARARGRAAAAALVGAGHAGVAAAVDAALEPRLLALSTTHFGLATPRLHPDREAAALALAAAARLAADAAWAAAEDAVPVADGTIALVNPRPSAGPALVDVALQIPDPAWTQAADLVIRDAGGAALPWVLRERSDWGDRVRLDLSLVVDVAAEAVTTLTWALEPGATPAAGGLSAADAPTVDRLLPPWTGCAGAEDPATALGGLPAVVDEHGVLAERGDLWSVPLCDGVGEVRVRSGRYAGLPGAVVTVDGTLGTASSPDLAESIALSPLACDGRAARLSWRTHGGSWRTRPVRTGVAAWNGQAADGSLALHCDDGRDLQVAHRVPVRSSMAFAPLRDRGGRTLVAPLGTLWGPRAWHDGRHTGGSGLGEVVTALVGAQFRPSAPDWSGQPVLYQLLVAEDADPAVLDLFAWPPTVRVGAFRAGD